MENFPKTEMKKSDVPNSLWSMLPFLCESSEDKNLYSYLLHVLFKLPLPPPPHTLKDDTNGYLFGTVWEDEADGG